MKRCGSDLLNGAVMPQVAHALCCPIVGLLKICDGARVWFIHIFGSNGYNAASFPIEEVGPAPVFEAAFDGEQGVGARRSRVFGNRPGINPC